ncbi:MAG: DUF421 domain-containing protein [Clostridia bacterium]
MGKRQLSQLQPFEFAITLVAAELACIPMSDSTIPITYGIIPIFTLVLLHNFFAMMILKSSRIRKTLNGKPVILIANGIVDCQQLKKCGMTANDLLESLRGQGYFKIGEIEYAIAETNGQLSILPKFANANVTNADLKIEGGENNLPYNIIIEGKYMGETITHITPPIEKEKIMNTLKKLNIQQKNIFIFSLANNEAFIQTFDGQVLNTLVEDV